MYCLQGLRSNLIFNSSHNSNPMQKIHMHEIILVKHRMKTPRNWLIHQQPPKQTAHKQLHYNLPWSDSHGELHGTSTKLSSHTHKHSSRPGAHSTGYGPSSLELQQGLQGLRPAKGLSSAKVWDQQRAEISKGLRSGKVWAHQRVWAQQSPCYPSTASLPGVWDTLWAQQTQSLHHWRAAAHSQPHWGHGSSTHCFGTPVFYELSGFATITTHYCTAAASTHSLG